MTGLEHVTVTQVQAPGTAPPTVPYSHALLIESGRLLFISGQGPMDGQGHLVGKDDPEAQIRQVFANIEALVKAAGGTMANIVALNAYLLDIGYRTIISKVRNEILRPPYPTATMVEISKLAFDEWLVEISAVAAL